MLMQHDLVNLPIKEVSQVANEAEKLTTKN